MNIILDIAAILIFSLAIYRGYKKGFVRTVLKLCGGIVCLILAITFSPTVGEFINESYMEPAFERIVSERLTQIAPAENPNEPDIDKIVNDQPNAFAEILEKFNIDLDSFKENFEAFKAESAENTTEAAIEFVAKPLSQTVSYVVAFIVVLVVSVLAVAIITFILDKLVKLPVLRTANKFLGIVSGILFGMLWVYILAMIIELSLPYLQSSEYTLLTQTSPNNTLVFKYFYVYNPIFEVIKALF